MGIETALLVGGGLIGNYISSQGAKKAAAAQAQQIQGAADQSAATQQAMYQQGQQATQPYAQAGTQALNQYQQNLTPQGRANFAQEYTQGPGYQQELARAEEASLRGSSAMGNMRAGSGAAAFQAIQPQLINQAYGQQMQGLQGLMGQGAGMAGQTAGLATGVGQSVGGTQFQGGIAASQPQYQANTAMSDYWGNAVGTVGGAGADYFAGINAPTQVYNNGGSYGR